MCVSSDDRFGRAGVYAMGKEKEQKRDISVASDQATQDSIGSHLYRLVSRVQLQDDMIDVADLSKHVILPGHRRSHTGFCCSMSPRCTLHLSLLICYIPHSILVSTVRGKICSYVSWQGEDRW